MSIISNLIPKIWEAKIIEQLTRDSEFSDRVKNDKDLTKKQKKEAMQLYLVGNMWAESYILGCKLKRDYSLKLKFKDGSYGLVQKFDKKDAPKTEAEIKHETKVLSELFRMSVKEVEKTRIKKGGE